MVKRLRPGVFLMTLLLVAVPAAAQNHTDLVARIKAESGAGAFASVDTMLELVLKVIAAVPDEHLGLVRSKPGAENTARYGNELVRVNRVLYPDGTMVKILGDSGPSPLSGNTPQWSQEETGAGALYVPVIPTIPVQPPPVVLLPPAPEPAGPSFVNFAALFERVIELQRLQLEKADAQLTIATDTNARVVSMDRTLTQTLGSFSKFAAKYIAPAIGGWYMAKMMNDNSAPAPAAADAK